MSGISEIKDKLSQVFGEQQTNVLVEIVAMVYEQVIKSFNLDDVKQVIKELAEAQRKTEERLNVLALRFEQLTEKVDQLAEAQQKTEERLNALALRVDQLAERVDQLAEAQRKTEERLNVLALRVDQLAERVEQLAEAQRKTEERLNALALRVDQLAEAQRETQEQLQKLAEAQTRVEDAIAMLLGRMKTVEERLDWVFHSIGFAVEDKSLRVLPELLKKEGIEVEGKLIRRYYWIKDDYNQINIFGWGKKNGSKILILGEVKMRASKKEVDKFLKIANEIKRREGEPPVFLVFVASDFHPNVEEYLQSKGIKYYWSFELD
ncbi:MAG: hypothetical protein ABDI07_04240 [Candidatus Kryptonium sp.]